MASFDSLWFIKGHESSARDLDMECRHRTAPIMAAFVRCYNVKVLALLHAMGHKQYVGVPEW